MAEYGTNEHLAMRQRVTKLEKQLRVTLVLGALLLGVLILTAWTRQASGERSFERIRVRQIIVVDEKGNERIYIGSPVPDPKVNGRKLKRISPATGITMNDENGNERNGWGLFPDGRQTLCFDYEKGLGEALCLTQGGERSGLVIKDPKQRFNLILGRLAVSSDEDETKMLMMGSGGKASISLKVADETGNPVIKVLGNKGEPVFETNVDQEEQK